jgi:hypothetical protein
MFDDRVRIINPAAITRLRTGQSLAISSVAGFIPAKHCVMIVGRSVGAKSWKILPERRNAPINGTRAHFFEWRILPKSWKILARGRKILPKPRRACP